MPQDRLSIHAEAVNLARRFSIQNENDLMQVRHDTLDKSIEKERSVILKMFYLSNFYLFSISCSDTGRLYG
jgi:hypothetical protein